jgi:perosamine synthetase
MSISEIENKITSKTKAIMPVHMYGHPVDMDPLIDLSKKYNLKIIEDSAEAHGCEYKGRKCGGLGDISTFSFYANKIITTGEGGMILTNSDIYAENARELRNLCFKNGRRFEHDKLGFNYRMTNLQAALGTAQIERIDEIVEKKIKIANYYLKHLRDLKSIILPVEKKWAKNVYWIFGFVLKDSSGETAMSLAKKMREEGIETRPFFLGMHQQPFFINSGVFKGESYPITERIAKQGIYIPSGLNLTENMQKKVVDVIKKILND